MSDPAAGRLLDGEVFIQAYTGNVADRTNAEISPVYGDLRGLAPSVLVVGSSDILLEDNLAMVARLSAAGNEIDVRVYPESPTASRSTQLRRPAPRTATSRRGCSGGFERGGWAMGHFDNEAMTFVARSTSAPTPSCSAGGPCELFAGYGGVTEAGSHTWLLENDLVDEMNLVIVPVVVGQGTRLSPTTART